MMKLFNAFLILLLLLIVGCSGSSNVKTVENGVIFDVPQGKMKLEVCREDIIRVMVSPSDTFSTRKSLMMVENPWEKTEFSSEVTANELVLKTAKLKVKANLKTGAVKFFDLNDTLILAEREDTKRLSPVSVLGEETWNIRQQWESPEDEKLYGLGHHQNGLFNLRSANIDLWQENWEIVVPYFYIQSRLWHFVG